MKRLGVLSALLIVLCVWLMSAPISAADQKQAVPKQDDASQTPAATTTDTAYAGGPKVFLPEPSHDFGKVKQNETLTHVFKIRNTGESLLKIEKVAAS